MNILDKIVEKTKSRVEKLDTEILKNKAYNLEKGDFPFFRALSTKGIKIIAEIKKASPSKGLITEKFIPKDIAREYKKANVDCISVLTEPYYFQGDNSYVEIVKKESNKPVLRKDFIIDEAQIFEAKVIGADCILLICAILDEKKLKNFLNLAHSLGLNALVEAHEEKEVKIAVNSGAKIIGVNNRNLKNFEVDFSNSLNLRKLVPNDIIFVSESGIKNREDILILEKSNVNAVLIGETFMRASDKVFEIKKLRGEI